MTAAPQPAFALDSPPDPDLVRIRDLVYHVAGIFHPDNKLRLLFDRCLRRMKALRVSTLRGYFECLTVQPNRQVELIALLNEITIGETSFFRNAAQLEALSGIILPKLVACKLPRPLQRLRIWSAGCSTGEEPYTISMLTLEQAQGVLRDWTVEIVATDLNENSLACARAGIYGTYSTRNLSPHYIQKYFTPVGEQLQLRQCVRTNVVFDRLNLSHDAQMSEMRGFDVIFCCNVLIYFDLASKRSVIRHLFNSLLPHGYLFLGQSESLYRVCDDFRLVHLPGATAYVKREREETGEQVL